jgi:hypothetical protein
MKTPAARPSVATGGPLPIRYRPLRLLLMLNSAA